MRFPVSGQFFWVSSSLWRTTTLFRCLNMNQNKDVNITLRANRLWLVKAISAYRILAVCAFLVGAAYKTLPCSKTND